MALHEASGMAAVSFFPDADNNGWVWEGFDLHTASSISGIPYEPGSK